MGVWQTAERPWVLGLPNSTRRRASRTHTGWSFISAPPHGGLQPPYGLGFAFGRFVCEGDNKKAGYRGQISVGGCTCLVPPGCRHPTERPPLCLAVLFDCERGCAGCRVFAFVSLNRFTCGRLGVWALFGYPFRARGCHISHRLAARAASPLRLARLVLAHALARVRMFARASKDHCGTGVRLPQSR